MRPSLMPLAPGGLGFHPLLRLHLRLGAIAPQLLLFALYLLSVLFYNLSQPEYRADVEERLTQLFFTAIVFLPIWLADYRFHTRGPLVLLVVPRRPLLPVFASYLAARLCLVLVFGALAFLVTVQRDFMDTAPATLRNRVLAYLVTGGFYVPVVTLFTLLLRNAILGSLFSMATFFGVLFACRRVEILSAPSRWFVIPHEVYSWELYTTSLPVVWVQILTCFLIWSSLAFLIFRRAYR